ncbi:MAG: helix-turn-helix domain-containing protein, partial [Rhodothermales bacterium]
MSELLSERDKATLSRLAENTSDEAARRRAMVLLLYQDGHGTQQIADELDMSPARVRHWRRTFLSDGLEMFQKVLDD